MRISWNERGVQNRDLQARMGAAPNAKMTKEIYELQERSNKEFRIENAAARVAEKERKEALYIKQEASTKRFLETESPDDRAEEDAHKLIVVGADHHFEMHDATQRMGLFVHETRCHGFHG
jgi:hypothetical protein